MAYTDRYLAYCASNGRTPEEQQRADAVAFPGGKMAGFIVWCSQLHERKAKS